MRLPKSSFLYLTVAALTLFGLAARLIDRDDQGHWVFLKSAFQPDGFNYLIRAIDLKGITQHEEIFSILNSLYPTISSQFTQLSPTISETLDARPVYPLITSLFLGVNHQVAPLIGPILAWITLIFIIFLIGQRRMGVLPTLSLLILFASSFYMRFNFIATTTDALSGIFFFLFIFILLSEKRSFVGIILMQSTLLLCIFTRPVDPIILATLLFYIFARRKSLRIEDFLPFIIVILHMIYLEVVLHQLEMGSVNTGGAASESMLKYLLNAVISVPKVVVTEFAFIFTNDIMLVLLLSISLILVIKFGTTEDRYVYAGITSSTFFLASLNGTIGSGFRYEIPIVMCSLVIWLKHGSSDNLSRMLRKFS